MQWQSDNTEKNTHVFQDSDKFTTKERFRQTDADALRQNLVSF